MMHRKGRSTSGIRSGTCGRCGHFRCVCGTRSDPRKVATKRDKMSDLQAENIKLKAQSVRTKVLTQKALKKIALQYNELQGKNDKLTERLMRHGEALQILSRLRRLYNLSPDTREPQVESAAKMMMRQAEKGLRIAQQRGQDNYITELQAKNAKLKELTQELVLSNPYCCWRKCWACKKVQIHRSDNTPGVLCRFCGSQDTRLLKEETEALKGEQDG